MRLQKQIRIITLGIAAIVSAAGCLGITKDVFAETRFDFLDVREGETRTLKKVGSPYIIKYVIDVYQDAKLIIEEGVVIKFEKDASAYIRGELEVNGVNLNDRRVIFTSYNDKNYYPEFSGSENPMPADWHGIFFEQGSKGMIQGALITYGDMIGIPDPPPEPPTLPGDDYEPEHIGVITVDNAEVNIANSIITNNYGGILVYNNGKATIHNSEIYGNLEYGIWVDMITGQEKVQASNNWWGYNSGPKHQTLNPDGEGNRVNSHVIFEPWDTRNEPVIIVPGIMGSWTNNKGERVLDPIFHTYNNLYNELKKAGYEPEKKLFTFPYNWRESNVNTALLLKEKINQVKQTSKSPRVDIIAHSMGGLVARQYIEGDGYENDIDQLITLGTPHRGSPESYLIWEGGVLFKEKLIPFPFDLREIFQRWYFEFEAEEQGYEVLFKYVREKVLSVGELLPVYDYLREAETLTLRSYPDNYPKNEFLENLNSDENVQKFRNTNIDFVNIVGKENKNKTLNFIRVTDLPEKLGKQKEYQDSWRYGYPENLDKINSDHGFELGEGDGTVPLSSASFMGSTQTLPLKHHGLAEDQQSIDEVIHWLTGTYPPEPPPEEPKTPWWRRFLFFFFKSPVDFQITDPMGRKIGKNFSTQDTFEEIPYAFYSGFQDNLEFVTIPNPIDGEYKVTGEGVGSGEYELNIFHASETEEQERSYWGEIQTGQEVGFTVQYKGESGEGLEYIENEQEVFTIGDIIEKLDKYYDRGAFKNYGFKNSLYQYLRRAKDRIEEMPTKEHDVRKIEKYLNKFINKLKKHQPELIELDAAHDLINMAQKVLAGLQT